MCCPTPCIFSLNLWRTSFNIDTYMFMALTYSISYFGCIITCLLPSSTRLFTVSVPRCFVSGSLSTILLVLTCLWTQSLRQGLSAHALLGRYSSRALRVRDMENEAGQKERQCKVMHYLPPPQPLMHCEPQRGMAVTQQVHLFFHMGCPRTGVAEQPCLKNGPLRREGRENGSA